MSVVSIILRFVLGPVILIGFLSACTDGRRSGNESLGTATNSSEGQTRFEDSGGKAMPSMASPDGEFIVTPQHIKEVQKALKDKGYNLAVNGLESAETRQAVENFQIKQELAPTGRIDRATISALNINLQPETDRTPASTKD